MADGCKYLSECLTGEIMACYASPETCDIFKRKEKSMADTLQEKVVEVIGDSICATLRVRRYVAAEIIKLLESGDKTLALIAKDADIPLWVAMQCAHYGKKAAMVMVNKVGEEYIKELEKEDEDVNNILGKSGTGCSSKKINGVKEFLRRLK